ncbi:acyltransferase [Arthrobacter sp. NPDC092385]|uniref:acyltransferase n=1 Tax=Arthrobacter sp. NPDC092385 TaxID=3363943 RepID=UPI0037FD9311
MGKLKAQLGPVLRDVAVNTVIGGRSVPRLLRGRLLNAVGHHIHRSAVLCPDTFLGSRTGLTVGSNSFINYGCFFDLGAHVTIGDYCQIGYQAMFVTCSHEAGPANSRAGAPITAPIVVGDGVWIGARATILPGVTVASGCVIAAGAVVVRDCEPDGLYAGVPAVRVRTLDAEPRSSGSAVLLTGEV